MAEPKPKSFWKRPEGVTGAIFLGAAVIGTVALVSTFILPIIAFLKTILGMVVSLSVLGLIIFMALDPKTRAVTGYMYKSVMRWITGLFVQIDPIGILKSYVEDLQENLRKMSRQISQLRGEMHKMQEMIHNNKRMIESNLNLASKARDKDKKNIMILKSRKAARAKESNMRLEDLYKKMEVLYRVLNKMYGNSEILMEDIKDQVEMKDQERKAIHASHSAMKSAMNIIQGDKDRRYMFDMALEAIADDVSLKVGEMERFMDMSSNFMQSVDLKNGIFEEEGLKMLEKWEQEGTSLILGEEKDTLILESEDGEMLDLNEPIARPQRAENDTNQYDSFFD